jgi:hypothetical protein
MFGHSPTQTYTFPLKLKSVEDSNLFLRKLWSEFRKEPTFSSMSMASKDGPKQFMTLGLVNFGKNPSSGVSVKYKHKGCVNELVFHMFPQDFGHFLKEAVAVSAASFKEAQPIQQVSYVYEAYVGQFQPYNFDAFSLSPVNDNKALLSLEVAGFDYIDAATQHKGGADKLFNLFSLFFKSSFAWVKVSNENVPVMAGENTFRGEEETVDEFYTEFEFSKEEFELVDFFYKNIDDEVFTKLHRALRLFQDGISIERLSGKTLVDNRKEVALSLYISALEVLAIDRDPSTSTCDECKQMVYKISSKVHDLVLSLSKSKNLAKMVKREYDKRSKYLHAGRFFSDNNFLGHHIPQLDGNTEHGNRLQYSHEGMLHTLRWITYAVVVKQLRKLKTDGENRRPA